MYAIRKIEAIPVKMPWRETYTTAYGPYPNERVVIRVFGDDGLSGVAEAQTDPYYAETADTVVSVVRKQLAPQVVDHDLLSIQETLSRMDTAVAGNIMAKSGVEVAILDLIGRTLDLPVARLLGGTLPDSIPLAWPISMDNSERMASNAIEAVSVGYRSLKLKIGASEAGEDLRAIEAIRSAVGPDVKIRVDANGHCSGRLSTLREMEQYDLEILEQPCIDLRGMARYRAKLRTPVMADESVRNLENALTVIREDAADIIKVQARHQGGVLRAREIAALASAAGLQVYTEGPIETSIGTAASTHLWAILQPLGMRFRPLLGMGISLFSSDLAEEPITIKDGSLIVSTGPGFGVTLNEAVLNKVRQD